MKDTNHAGGKTVEAWAACGDIDAAAIHSNLFRLEYPPKSGIWQEYPEVDRAEWFEPAAAKEKILPAQIPFITSLEQSLSAG